MLLDCAESEIVVVPCTPAGIEELAVGNAEHACIARKTKCLLLLASPSAELLTYMRAARDARDANDAPLAAPQVAVVQNMMPALSRVLAVSSARCTPAQVAALGLEEHVRESCDELMRLSPVLQELKARGELHVERATISVEGEMSLL